MYRTIMFPGEGMPSIHDISIDEMTACLKNEKALLWISLENPTKVESKTILSDILKFHPLAIEDCEGDGYQNPKVDDFGSYLFIIAHALECVTGADRIVPHEVNLFLGPNYLVTVLHSEEVSPIQRVWDRIERDERLYQHGSDFLCHAVLDEMIDDYFPLLDNIDDRIDNLETILLEKPNPKILEEILLIKHNLLFFRRVVSPQREIMNRLSRDDFELIDRQARMYFRDVYDHLVRIQDLTESLRDIASGTLDIYLNSTSLRLNEVMKALTVVSTIFLPLTFLAGVYGMNFKYMPELQWVIGYPLVWIIFILTGVVMIIVFKKRGWF